MEFIGGWYMETVRLLSDTYGIHKFHGTHGCSPHIQIDYDDDIYVYKIRERGGDGWLRIVDQDSADDYQRISRTISGSVGGEGREGWSVYLAGRRIDGGAFKTLRAATSSLTPEIAVAQMGISHMTQEENIQSVIWITDSRSTLASLEGNIWKADEEI